MKTVITYGTFDHFHYGHYNLLHKASLLGDYLIVGVSSDKFNQCKNKIADYDYSHRAKVVQNQLYVNKVITENNWEQKKQILRCITLIY